MDRDADMMDVELPSPQRQQQQAEAPQAGHQPPQAEAPAASAPAALEAAATPAPPQQQQHVQGDDVSMLDARLQRIAEAAGKCHCAVVVVLWGSCSPPPRPLAPLPAAILPTTAKARAAAHFCLGSRRG